MALSEPGPFAPGRGIPPGVTVAVTALSAWGTDAHPIIGTLVEVSDEPWPYVLVEVAGRRVFVGLGPGVIVDPMPPHPGG